MFRKYLESWSYKYFYEPGYLEAIISMILSPFAAIYSLLVTIKFAKKAEFRPKIPVISVGNLILGGSGKTPLVKAIYAKFSLERKTFIILRGYKRKSKGLVRVCIDGRILCDVSQSGDEAMEYAMMGANVIVSEDRRAGIEEALNLGARLVILDDGFGKVNIAKFNILLRPKIEPALNLTIPSGAYRYPKSFYKFADFIPSNDDISSSVTIENRSEKMVLISGIANPFRLAKFARECVAHVFFPDHYEFSQNELAIILKNCGATSILTTQKDYVKIKDFGLPLSILKLETTIGAEFEAKLRQFIQNYKEG